MIAGAAPSAAVEPSVLIVDDDWNVLDYLEDVFQLEGFRVTLVSDPRVVVGRLREERFQILVVDLMMPKIDGLDLLAQIRAVDSHTPVIMVTGYPSLETISAALQLGISAYLAHPITPAELRAAIERIARKQSVGLQRATELHEIIGYRIRSARTARGLTLEDIAGRTELSISRLSDIERGETTTSTADLFKLAAALNLRMARLFAGY